MSAKVLAGPKDVCLCGHKKTFHASIRSTGLRPQDEPIVIFDNCGFAGCDCANYGDALTPCSEGNHIYRYVSGGDENPQYRCEDCGSTDPEGDRYHYRPAQIQALQDFAAEVEARYPSTPIWRDCRNCKNPTKAGVCSVCGTAE